MAQLLVNIRHVSDDTWVPGQIIVVMPDDHVWGRLECPPRFVVIKIPNVSVDEFKSFLNDEYEVSLKEAIDAKESITDEKMDALRIENDRPRAWRFVWEDIPDKTKDIMMTKGYITVTRKLWDNVFRPRLRNEWRLRKFGVVELAKKTADDIGLKDGN